MRQILTIDKPLIQGLFFWLIDAKLFATFSEVGGLGPHAGQNSYQKMM